MKKRFFSLMLALAMVIALVPAALAEGTSLPDVEDGKITLTQDVTLSSAYTVAEDSTVVIDLAGFTLSSTSGDTIINNGTLTIQDSSAKQTGTILGNNTKSSALLNNGTAVIEGGTFSKNNNSDSNDYYVITNHGTLTINGGTISSASSHSSCVENGWYSVSAANGKSTTLTINGGTITSDAFIAVKNDELGTLNVKGGTITGADQAIQNWNKAEVSGGTMNGPVYTWSYGNETSGSSGDLTISGTAVINGDVAAVQNGSDATVPAKVAISGGTVTGSVFAGYTGQTQPETTAEVDVSGGTFSQPIASQYCAEGFAPLVQNGTYSVISEEDAKNEGLAKDEQGNYYENPDVAADNNVAMVGGTYYSTLLAAIDAVGDGETIYVTNNIPNATGISVPTGKNFTIDFGGHTYTLSGPGAGSTSTETNGFQLLKGSNITFKNGTIRIAEDANNIKRIIQNYANLTLEDMHIYAENQVGGEEYALSFNFGTVVFKGDTDVITTSADTAAFDVYFWDTESYQDGVSVTFDETYTGTINGTIIYDSTAPDKAALIIQGSGYIGAVDTSSSTSNGNNIQISGGTFGESVAEYVVDELSAELNSNGTYTYYETVTEALANAGPGDTITDLSGGSSDPSTPITVYTVTYVNGTTTWSEKVLGNSQIQLASLSNQGNNYFRGWMDANNGFYSGGDIVTITGDMTFTAVWDYLPPVITNPSHSVSVPSTANGTVSVSPAAAQQGQTVTVTVAPNEGYELSVLTVTDRLGNTVMTQANPNGTYSFVMPGSQVTVSAVFVETAPDIWVNPFVDVAANDWFYSYVEYVCENGLMEGTSAVTFEPASTVTRGTVATILWRLAGEPVVNYLMTFPDVTGDEWYGEAARWAASEGVITGYDNGNFAPNDPITREQLAVMLYRYAQKQGLGFTGTWAFPLDYSDADQVSDYAYEAMCWMTMNGVITGKDGSRLDPQGTATRSELAAMLARFCEII